MNVQRLYLLTGSNMGNSLQYLQQAAMLLQQKFGSLVASSSVYETAAWGYTNQANFLNQVLVFEIALPAQKILETVLQIEAQMGRVRIEKMGPRVIDIDIILYGNTICTTPTLTIPHALMHQRKFVLKPLAQVAAKTVHPLLHKTIEQLLALCQDDLLVKEFKQPNNA